MDFKGRPWRRQIRSLQEDALAGAASLAHGFQSLLRPNAEILGDVLIALIGAMRKGKEPQIYVGGALN